MTDSSQSAAAKKAIFGRLVHFSQFFYAKSTCLSKKKTLQNEAKIVRVFMVS